MEPDKYQCKRCGEVSEGPTALRRFCAFCGVHEVELERMPNPAAPEQPGAFQRLPAAV